jgi:hypothetical protein
MRAVGIDCLRHGCSFGRNGSGAFACFDTGGALGYLMEAIEPSLWRRAGRLALARVDKAPCAWSALSGERGLTRPERRSGW